MDGDYPLKDFADLILRASRTASPTIEQDTLASTEPQSQVVSPIGTVELSRYREESKINLIPDIDVNSGKQPANKTDTEVAREESTPAQSRSGRPTRKAARAALSAMHATIISKKEAHDPSAAAASKKNSTGIYDESCLDADAAFSPPSKTKVRGQWRLPLNTDDVFICANRECSNIAGQLGKPRSIYCSKRCQAREQNLRQRRVAQRPGRVQQALASVAGTGLGKSRTAGKPYLDGSYSSLSASRSRGSKNKMAMPDPQPHQQSKSQVSASQSQQSTQATSSMNVNMNFPPHGSGLGHPPSQLAYLPGLPIPYRQLGVQHIVSAPVSPSYTPIRHFTSIPNVATPPSQVSHVHTPVHGASVVATNSDGSIVSMVPVYIDPRTGASHVNYSNMNQQQNVILSQIQQLQAYGMAQSHVHQHQQVQLQQQQQFVPGFYLSEEDGEIGHLPRSRSQTFETRRRPSEE